MKRRQHTVRVVKVRSMSARLAVPLLIVMAVLGGTILGMVPRAEADWCEYSIDGITCRFSGTSTATTLPPYRYLRTRVDPVIGTCWYWSRYPPGLDGHNPAHDSLIIYTRFLNPECPATGSVVVDVSSRAWEVFRTFPLRAPVPSIRPTVGITNLASIVTASRPTTLRHVETLPDGRVLEVEAYVGSIPIAWGDGTPVISYSASATFSDGAYHAYALKTCPPDYRRTHPAGPNCHPSLEAYPVAVSFAWVGRYRTGGAWTVLGTLNRSASFQYDVDEVVGFPVAP